jgi:hypothetical protein
MQILCERVFVIVYQQWGYVDMEGELVYLGGNYCRLFQTILVTEENREYSA